MSIQCSCPECGYHYKLADELAGQSVLCPECKTRFVVKGKPQRPRHSDEEDHDEHDAGAQDDDRPRRREDKDDVEEPSPAPVNYPRMRRTLAFLQVRQRVRALCDAVGLGPAAGERIACSLILAVIPFAVSFGISFAVHDPAGYAVLRGLGAFTLVAIAFSLLLGWAGDEALAARQAQLVLDMPRAEEAWRERKERVRRERAKEAERASREQESDEEEADDEPRRTTKKCPYCREVIKAGAMKCKHCGEILDEGLREETRPRRSASPGVAAVLEIVFALFFQTFGIGHIYAGNVGSGLLLMFGYWLFVALNVAAGFLCCGLSWGISIILVPACSFTLLIVSPILAANSANRR